MADTFKKKDGDIREVLKTMFNAPEFWSQDAYRAKVKTPLEFVASSVRASRRGHSERVAAGAVPQSHGHAVVRNAGRPRATP